MKKFCVSFLTLCCVILGLALTSCGDDEPFISSDFAPSELSTPMFLFEQPTNGIVSSITSGFSFWTFTNDKAAYGSFERVGNGAVLKCSELYSNWSLSDGRLVLGNFSYPIKKVNALGVKAFTIKTTIYIPSNLSIGDFKGESIFTNLGLNKEKLWQGLERARQEGAVGVNEL